MLLMYNSNVNILFVSSDKWWPDMEFYVKGKRSRRFVALYQYK